MHAYLCFLILHKGWLVGRFYPNLDRDSGVLHLNALYLEPGIEPAEEPVTGVAAAMRHFLAWHGPASLHTDRSEPSVFDEKLVSAL